MQAGQIQGHIFKSMGSALRNGGLGALYSGHTAFIMQGLPYDVSELVTYSQLRAVKGPLNHMPAEVRDMLIGKQPSAPCLWVSCKANVNVQQYPTIKSKQQLCLVS